MDRRSFITALIGGFAVAGLGGATIAQAAEPVAPKPDPVDDGVKLDADALDKTGAEFSQYYRRRPRWRRRFYYRPRFYRRRYYYRPRYYRRRWRRW